MVGSRQGIPSWITAAATRVDFEGSADTMFKDSKESSSSSVEQPQKPKQLSDANLGFRERAFSAAGAAFISAILVNPLDVAKVIYTHKATHHFLYVFLCFCYMPICS